MIKSKEATINVSGLTAATFDRRYPFCAIRNDSSNPVYVSTANDKCISGMDGVVAVAAGGSFVIENGIADTKTTTVFFRGNGPVTVIGQYDSNNRFKIQLKGGETKEITPESLGYTPGAKMFFDGIYNFGQKHTDNGAYWIDMVSNAVLRRYLADTGKLLLSDNHYVKEAGADSALRIPINFNSDHFTTELFFEITSDNTSENDIINNFDRAGFGLFTENNAIQFGIFNNSSNAYQYINGGSYEQNTKYHIVATYNGENVIFYINGTIAGSEILALADYKKSTKIPYMGCVRGGGSYYSAGAYKFYRVAYYERALSQIEIINNYNSDIARFNV